MFANDTSKPIGIHIYPSLEEEEAYFKSGHKYNIYKTSNTYRKILNVIESSINYEPDASQACLFIPRFDTLSRDPKDPFFIKNLNSHFALLDEGRNHLIFNLFSGTWPNYDELDFLGFDPKMAILVKASCTVKNFRSGFDISLPLFDERLPEKAPGILFDPNDPTHYLDIEVVRKKHLLVFKGKRYTIGIGSEARNAQWKRYSNLHDLSSWQGLGKESRRKM
jgi:glucuronyl/N-acetylglucosaminyl transferase EXT1